MLIKLFVTNVPCGIDFLMGPFRIPIIIDAADILPWWIVMVVASTSAAIGSLVPYLLGVFGTKLPLIKKFSEHRMAGQCQDLWNRQLFTWLVILNAIPFVDLFGAAYAGWKRYPFWQSFAAMVIGRCLHNLPIVLWGKALRTQPWFITWLSIVHHPAVQAGLALVFVGFIIVAVHKINKAQLEYTKAQAVE